jgi:hypothetical protein
MIKFKKLLKTYEKTELKVNQQVKKKCFKKNNDRKMTFKRVFWFLIEKNKEKVTVCVI